MTCSETGNSGSNLRRVHSYDNSYDDYEDDDDHDDEGDDVD